MPTSVTLNVVFFSPHFPGDMPDFTRGLAEVGARVFGLGDTPPERLPASVSRYLSGYVHVPDLRDLDDVTRRVAAALDGVGGADRIECLWEPHVILAARLRERLAVPGMLPDTAVGFRDKAIMKRRLAAAGLRVPRFARATTADQARGAADEVGFPLVVKPIAGAGTADTHRVNDASELDAILATLGHVDEISVEEFIDGEEFTYDAVAIAGRPVFESVAQYHPKPLISRNEEWVSPAQIVFRDPHQPALSGGIELGRAALSALNMGTGFVHMEWFKTPGGEVVFGEIAARNGGAKLVDQMNFANDFDVYREWARAVCWHCFEATPHRRYHVAVVFKRAQGRGRIARIDGMDELRAFCGPGLVLDRLRPIGSPRRDWKLTLLSDGYVLMRDPDYQRCIEMMELAIRRVRMLAA